MTIPDSKIQYPNHHPMNPIDLLKRYGITDLTPEEEAELTRELSAAYHMDEAAATSRDVQRIAEKVRARLQQVEPGVSPSEER
jgi:hypothetical protein